MKMLAQRILTCFTLIFALCDNKTLLGAMAEDGVEQMNRILPHPGWTDLGPLEVLDQGKLYTVENLLMSDVKGQNLVTDCNLHKKVWLAHSFLNCDYALMFLTYIAYIERIGNDCSRTNITDYEKRKCLKKFKLLSDEKLLVLRMQTALVYLESLSPETNLTNEFYITLVTFRDVYEMIPDWKQERTIASKKAGGWLCFSPPEAKHEYLYDDKTVGTLELLTKLKENTFNFFLKRCAPPAHLSTSNNIESFTYSWFLVLADETYADDSSVIVRVNNTYAIAKNIINDFIVSDYTRMGFLFESNTTVLNRNPDTDNRVRQTNEILAHKGWSNHLGGFQFAMDEFYHSGCDLTAPGLNWDIVDDDNVDTKMRLAYGLMSCYFVEVIKELLSYIKSLAQLFNDKFEFFISFVKIIKNIDPVILRMRGTILYFQGLSPRTYFDKNILKYVNFLMNSIEMINLYQSKDYDAQNVEKRRVDMFGKRLQQFVRILFDFDNVLNVYTEQFCVIPVDSQAKNKVPANSQNNIKKQINEKINLFIEAEYPNLGFNETHFQALLSDEVGK